MKPWLIVLGVVAAGAAIWMFIDGPRWADISSTWWGIATLVLGFILIRAGEGGAKHAPAQAQTGEPFQHYEFKDYRPEWEKQMDVETRSDIGGDDERYARELCELLRARTYGPARTIGRLLDANGGIRRMVRVCLRVKHLGGDAVMLERSVWAGIGEWQN
jgi:hypothetical protein